MPDALAPYASARKFSLLLVEPQFVIRRTVVSVTSAIDGLHIREATGTEAARPLLASESFDGFLIDQGEDAAGVTLIERVRSGETPSPAQASVAIMLTQCGSETVEALRKLSVQRVLIKPFKVKTLLETVIAFYQQKEGREPAPR